MTDQPNTPQGSAERDPLKRYDLEAWYDWETSASGLDEVEHPEGDWVRYADVCAEREAQAAELERLRSENEAMLSTIDGWLRCFPGLRGNARFRWADLAGAKQDPSEGQEGAGG